MKSLSIVFFLYMALFSSPILRAQNFENLIGVRGGLSNGITFQHYMSEGKAVELLFHSRWRGFGITGLYEIHKPAFDVKGMQWYYGVGGHVGFYTWYDKHPWWTDNDRGTRAVIGVDGIIGLEYFIPEIPIQLSIDYKPAFNLLGWNGFWGDEAALSVRYCW